MLRVVVVASISFIAACDLFAIRCEEDDDCPNDVPFCVDDICVNEEEAERRGRDVDEEEEDGPCDADSDCPGGLCYDTEDESGFTGTCLPPEGLEDCASDPGVQGEARAAAGPVIFDDNNEHFGDGCYTISFRYFDRENDAEGGIVSMVVNGEKLTQSLSLSGGTAQGTACGAQFGQRAGLIVTDAAGNVSNTLCLDDPALSPAP
jgi:hypothetical protein